MKLARDLEMAATLCGAFLAGGGLDRVAVAMPAWRIVGANGWAAFSRHADLGNGLVLYPTAAISGSHSHSRQRSPIFETELVHEKLVCRFCYPFFSLRAAWHSRRRPPRSC